MKSPCQPSRTVLLLVLLVPALALASAGKVVIATGEAYAIDGAENQRPLQRRSDVFEGDTLVTGPDGALQIRFQDNAIMALREASRLKISEYHERGGDNDSDQVLMDLLAGGFRTITGSIGETDRDAYQVRTPNASIGIRGTHYETLINANELLLGVYQGGISVTNPVGRLDLGADSQFFFARISPDSRPQGLLNPPEQLNRPFSEETDDPGEAQAEDEPEPELTEEDHGIPIEEAFNTPVGDEPPAVPEGDGETATGFAESETLTFSTVEDEFETLLDDEDLEMFEDERLSLSQIRQLDEDPPRTGFVVVMDNPDSDGTLQDGELLSLEEDGPGSAVHFAYLADGDNGPVFANFESEKLTEFDHGYQIPDNVFKGPANTAPTQLASHTVGDDTVDWGVWNASPEDTAKLYSDPDSLTVHSEVSTPFFFVEATPAKTADLIGQKDFSLNCTASDPCIVASRPVYTIEALGELNVDFSTGEGSGYLGLQTENQIDPANYDNWDIYFVGQIQDSQFFSSVTSDSLYSESGGSSYGLEGNVDGLFTGPDTDLHFVGGFGVHSTGSDDQLNGVFLMESSTVPQ